MTLTENTSNSQKGVVDPPLEDLHRVFSGDTLKRNPYRSFYYFVRDLAIFTVIVSLLWRVDQWYWLIPLWILIGLNTLGLFQIGHEAAHGSLFKNPTISWWVGQIAFLPSLHPYGQWVYGHNRIHHDYTVRLKGDLAWHPRSPERYAKMSTADRIMHRIYWSVFGGGIYYLIKMWFQGLILHTADFPGARRDTRLVILLGVFATVAVIYTSGLTESGFSWSAGLWMFTKVQLIPFIILNYMIGITVYIHHIHPGIPFYNLPQAMEMLKEQYPGEIVEGQSLLRDYLRATRNCKLFDAQRSCWTGFK